MEKALARIVTSTAFRSSSCLSDIIQVVVPHLPADEGKALGREVATIMGDINLQIIEPLLEAHPEIREEWNYMIQKFDRIA